MHGLAGRTVVLDLPQGLGVVKAFICYEEEGGSEDGCTPYMLRYVEGTRELCRFNADACTGTFADGKTAFTWRAHVPHADYFAPAPVTLEKVTQDEKTPSKQQPQQQQQPATRASSRKRTSTAITPSTTSPTGEETPAQVPTATRRSKRTRSSAAVAAAAAAVAAAASNPGSDEDE